MRQTHPHKKKKRQSGKAGKRAHDRRSRGSTPNAVHPSAYWIYGDHAVKAALRNPERKIERIVGTPDALKTLAPETIMESRLERTEQVKRQDIEALIGEGKVHQGLAAQVAPLPELDLTDVLEQDLPDAPTLLVALDHVTDPQNVGAILRSTAAFGVKGLIVTRHNAPAESGVLAKAASGALETVKIMRVTNLKQALKACQDRGFWSVGLDVSAPETLDTLSLPERCILVLGAEGKGLRPGVLSACDFLGRLAIDESMESLNVSNAAAIAMYEWQRQKR